MKYLSLNGVMVICLLFIGCQSKKEGDIEEATLFKKLSPDTTHISFNNKIIQDDSLSILDYLYYYNGGGVAAGDVNNDGKTDLYFVSNRGENKLYLNEGAFHFKDVTKTAGVAGKANWKTGVAMVDINADGWLDIYMSVVGNYKGMIGKNELYINNQNGTFTEKAAEYGLDFKGFATQATFFDYDKDGDLDCYILTHAVHSVNSYDRVAGRALRDKEAGDYLMRNDSSPPTPDGGVFRPKFMDVSKQSGIYGAAMGYGLGIVTADINNDGWDDIYVSNDFHEDDYYYINQKNGNGSSPRFKESIKETFGHISKFSMGCDIADVNNDGYPDIFSTDMNSQDETVEKLSMSEDSYDIYLYKLQFGFYNQYSRNCLQLSHQGQFFSDISMMAGVASTDWSWSPLLADFDNDGVKDLFVSNGITRRPNDMDYIKYLSSGNGEISGYASEQKMKDNKTIAQMPSGKVPNYILRGTDGWKFEDKSKAWGFTEATISNGAIYADLDNDGDLDIITNDLDSPAGIYENQSEIFNKQYYLKIKLEGTGGNTQGIGAKVYVKNGVTLQYLQQQPIRGFMSSNDPVMHVGLGEKSLIDSIVIIWGNGKMEAKANVKSNQTLICKQQDAKLNGKNFRFEKSSIPLVKEIPNLLPFKHEENEFIDFTREPLIPFLASTLSPKMAVGDVNADGLDDIYQCGARNKPRYLLIQNANGSFKESKQSSINGDLNFEDTDALFFDADNDKDLDLYITSGGNEFLENSPQSKDKLLLNDGKGNFTLSTNALPDGINHNKSCVRPCDFDKDGDTDLFVGAYTVSSNYGKVPQSILWVNDGRGHFKDQTPEELKNIGMVTNAIWADLDNDKNQDLVVVGDWMGISVFMNKNKTLALEDNNLKELTGFWNGLEAADMDNDGDMDLIVGNLGTNTKYIKQANPKLRMYTNDMDGNGSMEQIVAYQRGEEWFPAASRDDFSRMAPALINHRFPDFKSYAGKPIDKLFTDEELNGKTAKMYEVNTFESVYLENKGNGKFEANPLPKEAQISKIYAIKSVDLDGDKKPEILLGGNLYGVGTYQGRYDASYGLILKNTPKGFVALSPTETGFVLHGEIRDIKKINTNKGSIIVVSRNSQTPQVFKGLK